MMFDLYFEQVNNLASDDIKALTRSFTYDQNLFWPRGEAQIIFNSDTAVELGDPRSESTSFIIWSDNGADVQDGQITVIGPELNECRQQQISFGKIIKVLGHGFTEDNTYARYQEMNSLRLKTNLEGYMLRAVPQDNKEWSRVSKKALQGGFSLQLLGNELIRDLKNLEYVDGVEIVLVTSSREDVLRFKPIGEKVARIISAMNKMFDNLEYDCATCTFADICQEVDGLRDMHRRNLQPRN